MSIVRIVIHQTALSLQEHRIVCSNCEVIIFLVHFWFTLQSIITLLDLQQNVQKASLLLNLQQDVPERNHYKKVFGLPIYRKRLFKQYIIVLFVSREMENLKSCMCLILKTICSLQQPLSKNVECVLPEKVAYNFSSYKSKIRPSTNVFSQGKILLLEAHIAEPTFQKLAEYQYVKFPTDACQDSTIRNRM